ncbi:hypothetical protein [Amycolatopsis dongchuanensis]|uniref:Uncharacterized protein n=1 Tax=Amycolatopsis dongchuanensis TaxID=1070866 RepID=A0ABP9R4G4_9PSEU
MLVLAVLGGGLAWLVLAQRQPPPPSCGVPGYSLTPEQAQNAATIAAVGGRLGMPDHAVTVALATALQESKLRNLTGGDRDSAGLFQQRPSQGWGTYDQVTDPVYAATTFYQRLRAQPHWADLSVTEAAQLVQRSGLPEAYARWEPEARALAGALTGQAPAAFTCHDLVLGAPADLVPVANAELGTARLTGAHDLAPGWELASWLVANATRFAIDTVTFDGRSWTADAGGWSESGPSDGQLTFHQRTPGQ